MLKLHNLNKTTTKSKRLGRGEGSGRGKNAGKGHKGQTKHGGKVRIGFEGGQKSILKRLPKFKGFKQAENKARAILTLSALNNAYQANEVVSIETLKEKGLITARVKEVRIIRTGQLDKTLKIDEKGIYLTKGAKQSIEK